MYEKTRPGAHSAGFFLLEEAMTNYEKCLESMYGLRRFGIKLGLGTIKNTLAGLGNPQKKFRSIHVAGTNGKGSVASTLAAILKAAGYRVGLYTSPHLIRFNERIRINNRPIFNKNVVAAYNAIKGAHHGKREPTFFEFATTMAFYEFGRQQVDWAVIETGMGGRLDATNAIMPELSIITNISLEHRQYLGDTLAAIALEKAGIIKRHKPVVTGIRQAATLEVVKETAHKRSAPLFVFGKDFKVRRLKAGRFDYRGMDLALLNAQSVLAGAHQIDNTALALAAVELLNRKKAVITQRHIRSGLADTHWPGRLEIVSRKPLIILDGAHNLMAARNLGRYLARNLGNRKLTMVIGILDDKPYASMLKSMLGTCSRVILTQAKINRALDPSILYDLAKPAVKDATIIADVDRAVAHAVKTAAPDEAICVAGSLYVVGEAMQALQKGIKGLSLT
jgi:dihydrofolate synthase/folylpolyglutamate synthase